jgi:hypothetical protein
MASIAVFIGRRPTRLDAAERRFGPSRTGNPGFMAMVAAVQSCDGFAVEAPDGLRQSIRIPRKCTYRRIPSCSSSTRRGSSALVELISFEIGLMFLVADLVTGNLPY